MELYETKKVVHVIGDVDANEKLAEGWKLLAVMPAEKGGIGGTSVIYVFGKRSGIRGGLPNAAAVAERYES
jgi:hypothetical protein